MKQEKFDISGMTCAACAAHVEKSVTKLGATPAVSLLTNSMTVRYDETALNADAIIAAVRAAGYGASVAAGPARDVLQDDLLAMRRRFLLSLWYLIPLMLVAMGPMLGLPLPFGLAQPANAAAYAAVQLALLLPILYYNRKYFSAGFSGLIHGAPNMDTLVATGATASALYSVYALIRILLARQGQDWALMAAFKGELYFDAAGMILTLITLGKYLETKARGKTGDAIRKLMDLTPKTATVLRDGQEVEAPVETLAVGDILILRPGARAPVDGVLCEGSAVMDESALTGESMPVEKTVGDPLHAGTVNQTGSCRMRATRVGTDTTLSQMIQLVAEAAAGKAPIAKLADKVAAVFVPTVMGIAVATLLVWLLLGDGLAFALTCAVAVLVVSCPCALGLATPVAIMVGTGKGASLGVLVKSAEALQAAGSLKTVIFDKTGTLTRGVPAVTDVLPFSQTPFLPLAAALEAPSEHPLGQAVVRYAREQGVEPGAVEGFSALPGRGVQATYEGKAALAGNAALLETHGIHPPDTTALAGEGKTVLYFVLDGACLGAIAVADTEKPSSRAAIETLLHMRLRPVMLTGDDERTARAIGARLGIEDIYAQVMPADKERVVREMGAHVAMVGDGINDAPALARADVGIALGAGTDIAMDAADIVLMKSDPLDVVCAIELSRAVLRTIKQNLFWAFFYNVLCIPLAAGVFAFAGVRLSPMFGAAAMSLSSLFVVTNALRLRFFQPHYAKAALREQAAPTEFHEGGNMKKIRIDGMMCAHCASHVEQALRDIGVTAKVDLAQNCACTEDLAGQDEAALKAAVEAAGYTFKGIE